jgi:hypothetical protein
MEKITLSRTFRGSLAQAEQRVAQIEERISEQRALLGRFRARGDLIAADCPRYSTDAEPDTDSNTLPSLCLARPRLAEAAWRLLGGSRL